METPRRIHVIARIPGGWVVRKAGASRALRRFRTKPRAILYAGAFLKQGHEVVIHHEDASIEDILKPDQP